MFIQIHQNYECSDCNAKNMQELVTRTNQQILRCRVCGHECVMATTTMNSCESGSVVYQTEPLPSVIKF
jgi:ribosomal protein L37AE/L43A